MDADSSSPSEAVAQNRQIPIRVPRAPPLPNDSTGEEPLSPTSRLMEGIYIVVMLGFGTPLNLPRFRAGFEAQLRHYPRFRSIQVMDGFKDGKPRWVRTTVNFEEHAIFPTLDPGAVTACPDQAVEDYVAALSTLPMDRTRPPWELHFLDFPTSEATSTIVMRAQHSLGDGMSLLAFLMASARSAADPTSSPAMLPTARRAGALYARSRSAGAAAFIAWVSSGLVLAWHTVVDLALFVATILFMGAEDNVVSHGKRFAHRTLSLDDIKFVKNAMNCTVNDVLVGVTSAALSRYYFRKSGDRKTRKITLRSTLVANIRPRTGLQAASFIIRRMLGNTTLLFSNMIGPVERVELWGHTVTFIAPSVYGPAKGLILNYQSYSSSIKVVLSFDEDKFPDHRHLLDDFAESLRLIKDEASRLTE